MIIGTLILSLSECRLFKFKRGDNMPDIKRRIEIARGDIKADIVFKNAVIANVFTGEFIKGDIAVHDGYIIAIGEYDGLKNVDFEGKIVVPTLIDGHVHIESSMVSPIEFTKAILKRGVGTIIADPHEIANVKGTDGIDYMLESTEGLPLKVYLMMPSCVPVTDFETSGAVLKSDSLEKYIGHERVLGLGEMMNFRGVIEGDPEVLNKLESFKDLTIDGHGPMISGHELNAYIAGKIKTEHECSTVEEMQERLRLGMYIQLREATGAKNLKTLLKGITPGNIDRCFFCTDDRHPESLISEGSIDNNIRIAISEGIKPIDAIKLATINTANAYGLKEIGAVAPNYKADFILLNDLETFDIQSVYISGINIDEWNYENRILQSESKVGKSVNIADIGIEDLKLNPGHFKGDMYVIGAIPDSLITKKLLIEKPLESKDIVYDNGYKKLVVVNRHTGEKHIGISAITGFGNFHGALATTIAHDSHNLIVIGSNDNDIISAINAIRDLEGGVVIVKDGSLLESLPLEIAGLMSSSDINTVNIKLSKILKICYDLGFNTEMDPLMALSFMALPVIPSLKLTDRGLFDVDEFKYIWRN